MFNLGMGEITVILLLALLFVGPSKLPELAAGLGKFIRQIRKATADVKNEIVLDDSFRKPFEELRDAVTLSPDELKRRDAIKAAMEEARRQAEEFERANAAPKPDEATADSAKPEDGAATPPPEPIAAASGASSDVPPPFLRRWRRFRRSRRRWARFRARRPRRRCRRAASASASA